MTHIMDVAQIVEFSPCKVVDAIYHGDANVLYTPQQILEWN